MLTKAGLAVIGALSTGREATAAISRWKPSIRRLISTTYSTSYSNRGCSPNTVGQTTSGGLLTDHPVVEAYRALRSELGHVEWPDLLSPATLRVCWYLDEPRRVSEIAERLKITRQGVHKALSPLKHRAMLSPLRPRVRVE